MTSNNENNSTMPDTDTPSYARMTATYSPEDNKLRLSSLTRLDKETYNRVKAAGFKWAPRQEIFVAPMWAPDREDLLIELCGEIGDEDTSLMERQEQRAERFEEYSDNRKADAEAAHKAVHAIADGIPLGQPILVGHHSEKHARKDAERIENGMRKAVKMWETSTYWTQRAASAIRHAKYKELPAVRARRIKGLESDIRVYRAKFTPDPKQPAILQQRWNDPADAPKVPHVWCAPRGGRGGSWVPVSALPALEKYYSRWIQHCENRLEYERAMLDEQGATDLLKPKPRSAAASLPLCNYSAPGGLQIENKWNRGEMIYYHASGDDPGRICPHSRRLQRHPRGRQFAPRQNRHAAPHAGFGFPYRRQDAHAARTARTSAARTPRTANPDAASCTRARPPGRTI
jgi:hypothetical protein